MRYLKVSILLGMVALLRFDVLLYRISRDMPSRTNVIAWSPQPVRACAFAELGIHQAELASRDTFEELDGLRNRHGRRHRDEEVYVIRLDIDSQNIHVVLVGNRMQQILQRRLDWLLQHITTIHRAPHYMIGCQVYATSCMYRLIHMLMVARNCCVCNATLLSSPH